MKKIAICIVLLVIMVLCLTACNKQIFDTKYKFTNAYIKVGDEVFFHPDYSDIDYVVTEWEELEETGISSVSYVSAGDRSGDQHVVPGEPFLKQSS